MEVGDISITNTNNIADDDKFSVLWHSTKNPVNFIRHLASIKILCLANSKHVHCSQQQCHPRDEIRREFDFDFRDVCKKGKLFLDTIQYNLKLLYSLSDEVTFGKLMAAQSVTSAYQNTGGLKLLAN